MVLFYLENVTFGFLSGNGLKTNFFMCFREVILTETEDNNVFKSHMSNNYLGISSSSHKYVNL